MFFSLFSGNIWIDILFFAGIIFSIFAQIRVNTAYNKYSKIATLDEIKENDYNLNIPRYVDTFEEEEPIDIEAVADDLLLIESELTRHHRQLMGMLQDLVASNPEDQQKLDNAVVKLGKIWNSGVEE